PFSHLLSLPLPRLSILLAPLFFPFFFSTATATSQISTLSLHDALPILRLRRLLRLLQCCDSRCSDTNSLPGRDGFLLRWGWGDRSEEHTSELQSRENLVCRLLLEKKNGDRVCFEGLELGLSRHRGAVRC